MLAALEGDEDELGAPRSADIGREGCDLSFHGLTYQDERRGTS